LVLLDFSMPRQCIFQKFINAIALPASTEYT
jgi:hypothetical protein